MALNINQFSQSPVKGQLDLLTSPNTISAQVDSSESGSLVPGQAVTIVDSSGGVPKVIAAAADEDDIFGFVNFNIKDAEYVAGDRLELSFFRGNVMFMEADAAIARNAEVMIVVSGQKVVTATSTNRIIGRALDKASAQGDLIRVIVDLPGAIKA